MRWVVAGQLPPHVVKTKLTSTTLPRRSTVRSGASACVVSVKSGIVRMTARREVFGPGSAQSVVSRASANMDVLPVGVAPGGLRAAAPGSGRFDSGQSTQQHIMTACRARGELRQVHVELPVQRQAVR